MVRWTGLSMAPTPKHQSDTAEQQSPVSQRQEARGEGSVQLCQGV